MELVRMNSISKYFPGVTALQDVNFSVKRGEVHALVGENGAGKSTLIKILMGVHTPSQGEIFINGNKETIKSPQQAKQLGLGAVYQDVNLAPHLSVSENFFLGALPQKNGFVDWKSVNQSTKKALNDLNILVDVKARVKDLSIAQQEMVVIAKTVFEKAQVLIFDEPTALLANDEVEILFCLIRNLRDKGYGIIYVSHRLEEIFELCNRVTVLKDGRHIKTLNVTETNSDELIHLMVGRDVGEMYDICHQEPRSQETVLKVKQLSKKNSFENISFELKKGEILGMFGLVGSGRTDIVRCIFGADPHDSGEIEVLGKKVINMSPRAGIQSGIALLPENRQQQGLALSLSIEANINQASYSDISKAGFVNVQKEEDRAKYYKNKINIIASSVKQKVKTLSGGNQQKVVIAKWCCKDSDILIFDECTVGVDVGAKVEIYKLFEQLIENGKSIILISSYLPEVIGLSDRIMVMSEGKLVGIVDRDELVKNDDKSNEELILKMASGLVTQQGE
jgi:ribose transport system ATP-binding protein